ncbi:RHS repeat-associated core domain-containing protein [Chryseobacterium sp.]|uniref:RHS repeat-associated core domain-containing protein n=1 Tax=Chryseobacterium sp. TaxID=1871047 RepID=UPI0026305CF1|nr:RHS repeat-associated core domain-containing protein [Chryseobacterium sp.]
MIKKINFLGLLMLFLFTQFVSGQQSSSINLQYDISGYQENQSSSSQKTVSPDYVLTPSVKSEMSINESGALTYTVPIETLKGLNSFQPNIALVYNSQSGNGNAGWGWSLTGLSTITKGGKSQETDGMTIGVQFNETDPYYLDGQRLLKKSDTEYITKNYSQIKITKSTGTYSFIIQFTDGKIAWYKELVTGQHYISKMADAFNNEIHYAYSIVGNIPRLDKISYGGTDSNTDKYYLNISYADRKKVNKVYRNGQVFLNTKIISEITAGSTYTGNYRKYSLNFDFVDSNSTERLRTITVFNANGESLKPLNFNYNTASNTATANVTKRQLASVPASTHKLGDATVGNFYNNNENDIFYVSATVTDFRSGPSGGFGSSTPTPAQPGSLRNPIFYLNSPYGPITPNTFINIHTRLFTGKTLINDNKLTTNDQLIIVNTVSKTNESEQGVIEIKDFKTGKTKMLTGGPSIPWVSSGSFNGQPTYMVPPRISQKMFIPGDFNNDGLFDLIYITGNTAATQKLYLYEIGKETGNVITRKEFTATSLLLTEDNYKLLEMDGDGIPEIMIISGNQYGIYKINVQDMTIKPFGDIAGQSSTNILNDLSYDSNGNLITPILLGDFNGDGLTDFVTPKVVYNTINPFSKLRPVIENSPEFKWWLYTSDGKKFIPTQLDLTAQKLAYVKPSQDESIPKQSAWDLFMWGPADTFREFAVGNVVVTDLNNDGKSDLVSVTKFGKLKYNDQNPVISNITYESGTDKYQEFVYSHSCYDLTGQSIPAIYNSIFQAYRCIVPNFPFYVGPYSSVIGNTQIPGIYLTALPRFNKINFYINTLDNNGNTIFNKLDQEVDIKNERITPFSLFLSSDNVNFLNTYKTSISNFDVTTGTEFKVTFNNDNFLEKQIQEVNNGSTVLQKVEYRPMMKLDDKQEVCYLNKDNDLFYPLYTHQTNGSLYLVNKVHTLFSGKILTTEYRYENAIQALDGRGSLGFQKSYKSDTYESELKNGKYKNKNIAKALFWNVSTRDPLMNNALVKSTYGGLSRFLTETTLTNKKYQIGNQQLILATDEITADNLRKITISKKYYYDEADQLKLKKAFTNYNGESTSESTFTYHPEFTNGQHFFYGKISEQSNNSYKDGMTFTTREVSTYYPENGSLKVLSQYSQNSDPLINTYLYDNYGNIKESSMSAAGIAAMTKAYIYDTTNRYVTSTTNPDGLTNASVVNFLGQTLEETSGIGLKTSYAYDSWGNITSITDYLGKKALISKAVSNELPGAVYQISKNKEGGTEEIAVFDEFDREIKIKKKSFNDRWIATNTEYDILGKVTRQSQPFFDGEAVKWNTTEYDDFNRIIKNVTYTGKVITTCYEGLKVTVEDGYQKTSKTLDAIGNTIRHQDHGGVINYSYYPNGALKETNYEGSKTTYEIDDWGNKKKMIDPSLGTFNYFYDNAGRLTRQESPKGYTEIQYDNLGRISSEKVTGNTPAENTNIEKSYQYHATSKLPEKVYGTSNGKNFAYTTEYDQYYRVKTKTEQTPDFTYSTNTTFDVFGRVDEVTLTTTVKQPNVTTSSKTKNVYDNNGIRIQQNDVLTNKMIWHVSATNALEQNTQMEYGNGYIINNYYSPQNGGLLKVNHANGSLVTLDINYDFDVNKGVLKSRNNNNFGITESFEYDALNRLIKETTNGAVTNQYTYDKRGRMTGNTELGQYNYNGNDYKLQNIAFNANGQQVEANRGFAETVFNGFNAPLSIVVPNRESLSFEYNLLGSRYAMTSNAAGTKKYYTSDGAVEIFRKMGNGGAKLEIITYINGDSYSANYIKKDVISLGTFVKESNNYYLHRDHLGSILAITKTDGSVAEKRFFDAWGNLKGLANASGQFVNLQQFNWNDILIDRGYTGHEHLWRAGLIHMNARVYDPIMRRFLSPDQVMQDAFNTQNYNRYGYVFNNPLFYTDPSGNIGLGAVLIIAVAVSATTHAIMNTIKGIPFWYGMGQAMTTGLASGIISFGIGSVATSLFSEAFSVGKAAFQAGMHAVSSGAMSEVGGGKFISGLLSGAMSSLISSGIEGLSELGEKFNVVDADSGIGYVTNFGSRNSGLVQAIMLTTGGLSGGISSSIAGGNFWDGLKQGLITSGLNHVTHFLAVNDEILTQRQKSIQALKSLYPRFYEVLKGIPAFLEANPKVLESIAEHTKLTKDKILEYLNVDSPTGPVYGLKKMSNLAEVGHLSKTLMSLDLLNTFEKLQTPEFIKGTSFLLTITVLHEFVHWGRSQNILKSDAPTNKWGLKDYGDYWEMLTFGMRTGIDKATVNLANQYGWKF